ncbi:MAG: ferritin-like domain-containing protein, partial [Proteobacteria bacterium]|nr:ferritin-like domain-containing protein [Pseudomonadota bacterium]
NRPARPARPALRLPRDLPKRKISRDSTGRIALLHALAHIELNAIDLAWDMIARFAGADLPRAFFDDWVGVAVEESGHFALLDQRLAALGAEYGDLPAHDGLWAAAEATAHDLLARLAVVPLVLEARGLDVTPAMISRLRAVDDAPSADILEIIYRDEIGHVAVGKRWFDHVVAIRGLQPVATWQDLVRRYFKGGVKPPFNIAAREAAGFSAAFYGPLGDEFLARKAS